MKILLDMNISPVWKKFLEKHGHDVFHWSEVGDQGADDELLMTWARDHDCLVFTHDLDFSAILYATRASSPSVLQVRIENIIPSETGKIILEVINTNTEIIQNGAVITVDPRKSRVHLLPFKKRK